jgi:hypothetical protein
MAPGAPSANLEHWQQEDGRIRVRETLLQTASMECQVRAASKNCLDRWVFAADIQ